ncbi:MAG: hypothetical protein ACYCSZ_13685 [Burkholderiales bacterium]
MAHFNDWCLSVDRNHSCRVMTAQRANLPTAIQATAAIVPTHIDAYSSPVPMSWNSSIECMQTELPSEMTPEKVETRRRSAQTTRLDAMQQLVAEEKSGWLEQALQQSQNETR